MEDFVTGERDGFGWLRGYEDGWQVGEAGVLLKIVQTLGIADGVAVEFGAGGVLTCHRILEEMPGWKAFAFDVDQNAIFKAMENHQPISDRIMFEARQITPRGASSINQLFADRPFDLLVIDVDSNDYEYLETLDLRPAVLCIEIHDRHDSRINHEVPRIPENYGGYDEQHFGQQANKAAVDELAKRMGYVPVYHSRYNGVYVHAPVAHKLWNETPCAGPRTIVANPPIVLCFSQPRLGFTTHAECNYNALVSLQRAGLNVTHSCRAEGPLWEACLTQGIEDSLRHLPPGCGGYILFSDYDGTFNPNDLVELLRIAQSRDDIAAVYPVQAHRHRDSILTEDPEADYTTDGTETNVGHFGLTLISADLLRRLPRPWFWSIPDPVNLSWHEGKRDADIFFWNRLREYGGRIIRANNVVIGHIEQCVKWPLPDGKCVWQTVSDYAKRGRPQGIGALWAKYRRKAAEIESIDGSQAPWEETRKQLQPAGV